MGISYMTLRPTITMSMKVEGAYWKHECNRCGEIWYSRNESPKNCNNKKCKSPYWNKERVR